MEGNVERNTGEIIRNSQKGLVPYTTWAGVSIGVGALIGFLVIAHVLGLWWIVPLLIGSVVWAGLTAHGFRHGWLK